MSRRSHLFLIPVLAEAQCLLYEFMRLRTAHSFALSVFSDRSFTIEARLTFLVRKLGSIVKFHTCIVTESSRCLYLRNVRYCVVSSNLNVPVCILVDSRRKVCRCAKDASNCRPEFPEASNWPCGSSGICRCAKDASNHVKSAKCLVLSFPARQIRVKSLIYMTLRSSLLSFKKSSKKNPQLFNSVDDALITLLLTSSFGS